MGAYFNNGSDRNNSNQGRTADLEDFVVSNAPGRARPLTDETARIAKPEAAPSARSLPQDSAPKNALDSENLFEAVQELGNAVRKERAYAQRLNEEMALLKQKHHQELRDLEDRNQKTLQLQEELKAAFTHEKAENLKVQAQAAQLKAQYDKMHEELSRTELRDSDNKNKTKFELELLQSAQEYNRQRSLHLQQMVTDLRAQLDRARQERDRERRDLIDRENKAKITAASLEAQNRGFQEKIAALQGQLQTQQANWAEIMDLKRQLDNAIQQKDEAIQKAEQIRAEHRQILQSVSSSRSQNSNIEAMLESERNEKHMVLGCLKSTELKLSRAEARINDLTTLIDHIQAPSPATPKRNTENLSSYVIAYPENGEGA